MQARILGRRRKSNHAVETVVVRDGEPGEAQFYGTGDQLVRRRGAVEERKMRVGVEFRVFGQENGLTGERTPL
jgi:hypothetical protein